MTVIHEHKWMNSEPCRHGDYRRICDCGADQLVDKEGVILEDYDRRKEDRREEPMAQGE